MAYNHFTIAYLTAIQECLNIYPDSTGVITVAYEGITNEQLTKLKARLAGIWKDADSAVEILGKKEDAHIQSCLFGMVNDFDLALKTGFLLGDRIVLVDYLYERILCKKSPDKIDREHLGVVIGGLVSCLDLAKSGRVVLIAHPLSWNKETVKLYQQVAAKGLLDPSLMSLLSVLSIAKICKLQPYTIAESDEEYQDIINHRIELTDHITRDRGFTAYKAILGALMTEKLITETNLYLILNIPLTRYAAIIAERKDFYLKYTSRLTEGNSDYSNDILEELTRNLQNEILDSDISVNKMINDQFGTATGLISTGISVAVASISTLSVEVKIVGAALGLLSKFSGLFKNTSAEDKNIIAVFKKLYRES